MLDSAGQVPAVPESRSATESYHRRRDNPTNILRLGVDGVLLSEQSLPHQTTSRQKRLIPSLLFASMVVTLSIGKRQQSPSAVVCLLLLMLWLTLLLIILPPATSLDLHGKRVLVTGSSGGIGKGIAKCLAAHGAHVLLHYHTRHAGVQATRDEIRAAGVGVVAGIVQCDFRLNDNIHRLFDQDIDGLWPDGLDCVVNNAGLITKLALEDDTGDLSAWHETLQVNLHAPRLISHLAMRRMKKRQQSSNGSSNNNNSSSVILNVSSIHGERSNEYMGAYAVSKSALDALTRTMALEYAPHGIRVNAIAPGVVPVERTAQAFATQHVAQGWKHHIPLRTLGTVEQVAEACLPLITNEWITGTIWQVDGGMMARSNMPERARPRPEG